MRDILICTTTSPLEPCRKTYLSVWFSSEVNPARWEVQLWFGGDSVLRGLQNREQAAGAEHWAHMLSEPLDQKARDLRDAGQRHSGAVLLECCGSWHACTLTAVSHWLELLHRGDNLPASLAVRRKPQALPDGQSSIAWRG